MVFIPFIYFICIFLYIYYKQKSWNMDLAATTLLITISFFAIIIDIKDLYGEYGINNFSITAPTCILFCVQWTFVILLIKTICRLPLQKHIIIKEKLLYAFLFLITIASGLMIVTKITDIRDALIMDMADVREQHYSDLAAGASEGSNYFMLIPNILTCTPIPTAALFFWFYMKSFMKCPAILTTGILIASIVQAIIAIIMAGRAAMIYWAFDFFLLYSFFYQYLDKSIKKKINFTALAFGGLATLLFVSITVSRFGEGTRDPLDSLYGYAGQHMNNFCAMFVHGSDAPISFDRIFPLTSKILGNQYDMMEHYENITSQIRSNIIVNVFDTFGGEIYLDLGWMGYIMFFFFMFIFTIMIQQKLTELKFHNVFILIIIIAFFTRGLFAWPFTNHYTTLALILTHFSRYSFKYLFKI